MTTVVFVLALGIPDLAIPAGPPGIKEAISAASSLAFTLWLARFAGRRARPAARSARVLRFTPKHALTHFGSRHHPR